MRTASEQKAYDEGAEAMRAEVAANLQRWVDALIKEAGKVTMSACSYAGARQVALGTALKDRPPRQLGA